MQLVMYLGNDFIASANINAKQVSVPGYMGRVKRKLMEENSQLLQDTIDEPEFLIADLSSATRRQEPAASH